MRRGLKKVTFKPRPKRGEEVSCMDISRQSESGEQDARLRQHVLAGPRSSGRKEPMGARRPTASGGSRARFRQACGPLKEPCFPRQEKWTLGAEWRDDPVSLCGERLKGQAWGRTPRGCRRVATGGSGAAHRGGRCR